jgi:hypothetical protein
MPIGHIPTVKKIYTCDFCYYSLSDRWSVTDWLIDEENDICLCPKHVQHICKNCGKNFLEEDWTSELCSKKCSLENYRKEYEKIFKIGGNTIKCYSGFTFSINDGDLYDIVNFDEDGYIMVDWDYFEKAINEILNVN